jgi:hypothetical protein
MNYLSTKASFAMEMERKLLSLSHRIKHVLNNKPVPILLVYWALTQLAIFNFLGVRTSVDTPIYVQDARDLLSHLTVSDVHDFWYISYVALVGMCLKFADGLHAVAYCQIFLSGLALLALYKVALVISSDKKVALIAGFLYVFWFEIHTWNTFIYTESLFISCSIITFFLLVHSRKYWQYALTFVFIFFTCLIRPTGFSLLVASVCYLFAKLEQPMKLKILVGVAATCLILILLNKMLESYELISSYAKGEIIYPNVTFLIDRIRIEYQPSYSSPLVALIEFIFRHPIFFSNCVQ